MIDRSKLPDYYANYNHIGICWWVGRCDWWNPPLDMILEGGGDYCIKCWEFKK